MELVKYKYEIKLTDWDSANDETHSNWNRPPWSALLHVEETH